MNRLWAPWRSEYITQAAKGPGAGCVFCDVLEPGEDRARLVLYRAKHTFVVMNRFPYNNGHVLVLPNAHQGRLDELDGDTFAELNALVARSVTLIERALHCDGINLGMNLGRVAGAGIPGHLHYHIVPRWNGDTNFMPVVGETKVISQHILSTYDQLKPHFDALPRDGA